MAKKRKKQRVGIFDDLESESTPTTQRKTKIIQLLDPAKVAQLLRDSMLPVKEPHRKPLDLNYHTYSPEEASALVREYLDGKNDPSST